MLRKIPKNISPELMKVLMQMGHGDEIVFGDANFPSESMGSRVLRADGDSVLTMLEAVMPFFPLDDFVEDNVFLMAAVPGKGEEPAIWDEYRGVLEKNDREQAFDGFSMLERQEFYDRAQKAFAVVATGEMKQYANIILKKGVVKEENL